MPNEQWLLKHTPSIFAIIAVLVICGIWAYRTLPPILPQRPTEPHIRITTFFPGLTAVRVESLTTRLEKTLRPIGNGIQMTSGSFDGLSHIAIHLPKNRSALTAILPLVQGKLASIENELPATTSGPHVEIVSANQLPLLLAVHSPTRTFSEIKAAALSLHREVIATSGVEHAEMLGIHADRIVIRYSESKLSQYNLKPYHILNVILNEKRQVPLSATVPDADTNASSLSHVIEQLKGLSVKALGNRHHVRLDKIATVSSEASPPNGFYKGHPSFFLSIRILEDNLHKNELIHTISHYRTAKMPSDIAIETVFDPYHLMQQETNKSVTRFLESAFMTMFTVYLLFGIQSGIVLGLFLILMIFSYGVLMRMFTIPVGPDSLMVFIFSLSLIASPCIVSCLNTIYHPQTGFPSQNPPRLIQKQWKPASMSALIFLCTFIPIWVYIPLEKQIYTPLFLIMAVGYLCACGISAGITPLLCRCLFKPDASSISANGIFGNFFSKTTNGILRFKISFLILIFVVTLIALVRLYSFQTHFPLYPKSTTAVINLIIPPKASLQKALQHVRLLEENLTKEHAAMSVSSYIETPGDLFTFPFSTTDTAEYDRIKLVVKAISVPALQKIIFQIRSYVSTNLPNIFQQLILHGTTQVSPTVRIRLSGNSFENLYKGANLIKSALAQINGIIDITDNCGDWELNTIYATAQDKHSNNSPLRKIVMYHPSIRNTQFAPNLYIAEDQKIPVVIQSNTSTSDMPINESIRSTLKRHSPTLLYEPSWGPHKVYHHNTNRALVIQANIDSNHSGETLLAVQNKINRIITSVHWPKKCKFAMEGAYSAYRKRITHIPLYGAISISLLFILLVIHFNSTRLAFIVVLSLVPILIGIAFSNFFFPFYIMDDLLSLGVTVLFGIGTTMSILTVHIVENERSTHPLSHAIKTGCPKSFRFTCGLYLTFIASLVPFFIQELRYERMLALFLSSGALPAAFLSTPLCAALYAVFFNVSFKKVVKNRKE